MKRIKELRKQHGLSQIELGKVLNIAQNTLSAYERGSRDPDTDTLASIAQYFGVSVDYLLGRTDIPDEIKKSSQNSDFENKMRPINDDDIKVALFGGDGEVTDEMWNEVKNFAAYVKSKQKGGK